MLTDHRDVLVVIKSDLVRGHAAYARDEAGDLSDGARALRAKGQVLRRHCHGVRAASVALRDESDQLLRRIRRERLARG